MLGLLTMPGLRTLQYLSTAYGASVMLKGSLLAPAKRGGAPCNPKPKGEADQRFVGGRRQAMGQQAAIPASATDAQQSQDGRPMRRFEDAMRMHMIDRSELAESSGQQMAQCRC